MPRPPRQTTRRRHTRRRRDPTYRGKRIDRASCLRLAREIPEPKYPAFRRSVRTQLPATGYQYKPRPADTPEDVTNELFDLIDDARASSSSRSPRGQSTRRRRPRGPKRTWRRTAKKVAKYVLFGALLAFSLKTTWGVQQELEKVKGEMATLKRGVAPVGGPAAGVGAASVGSPSATNKEVIISDLERVRKKYPEVIFIIKKNKKKKNDTEALFCYQPDANNPPALEVLKVDLHTLEKQNFDVIERKVYKLKESTDDQLNSRLRLVGADFTLRFIGNIAPKLLQDLDIQIQKSTDSTSPQNYEARTKINGRDVVLEAIQVEVVGLQLNPIAYIELHGKNGEWELLPCIPGHRKAKDRLKEYAQAHP